MELLQELKRDIIEDMKTGVWTEEQKIVHLRMIDLINVRLRLLEEKSLD